MFDFDQTLACYHVYSSIRGTADNKHSLSLRCPEPFARSELGQLRCILQYNAAEHFSAEGGFSLAAFGGPERVRELSRCLDELKTRGVHLILCSNGYVAPMQKILSDLGLLQFFDLIYGRLGYYHIDKETNPLRHALPLDSKDLSLLPPEASAHMGKPEQGSWGDSKIKLLNRLKEDSAPEPAKPKMTRAEMKAAAKARLAAKK